MRLISLLFLVFLSCTAKTKPEPKIIYSFDAKTSELLVQVRLPKGIHAYAPGETIGKPVNLIILPLNNWELSEPLILPIGNTKNLLNIAFEIRAKLKGGHGPVFGILKMQLCSDNSCERPQEYPFQAGP
jgi:hypothetical protein